MLLVVEVHGAALALGGPGLEAEELRDHLLHGEAAQQRHAVTAIGSDPGVPRAERRLHARGHGLLAVVQVAEAADRARLCCFIGFYFVIIIIIIITILIILIIL